MDSIAHNKKYKEKKKEEKKLTLMLVNREKTMSQTKTNRTKYWNNKSLEAQRKRKEYYLKKQIKDVAKRLKKKEAERDKKIKNQRRLLAGKKQLVYKKKDKTLAWYKKHSCSDYQRCVRFLAKDEDGLVSTIDGKRIQWNRKCDAGHIFPKSTYPHLIFHPHNCYPQSKYSNKELGKNVGLKFKDAVIKRIGKSNWNKLVKLADNKQEANKLLSKLYWKDKYNIRHKKRLELEKTI